MFVLAMIFAAAPWSSMSNESRTQAIAELHALPLSTRFVAASERFLGTPYRVSPLGEAGGRDADPLIRWDAVDCVTLVEESMAVALVAGHANDAGDASVIPVLNFIRYAADQQPSWTARQHIMEAQWLPGNVKKGLIRDVTREIGESDTRRISKRYDDLTWKGASASALALPASARPMGHFELDIIASHALIARLQKAPSGLIVLVVRRDRVDLITRVSHVGILIQTPKGPRLRHASRSFRRVVDEPLETYVSRNLNYASWTIEGMALFELVDSITAVPARND